MVCDLNKKYNQELKQQNQELKQKISELEAYINDKKEDLDQVANYQKIIEKITFRNEEAQIEKEQLLKQIAKLAEDYKTIKQEKELAELELEEAILLGSGGADDNNDTGEANQSLIIANGKLRA